MFYGLQVKEAKLLLQAVGLELAADLDQDVFVFAPSECAAERRKTDFLGVPGAGVHLDLAPFGIKPRVISHLGQIEIAACEPIDILEDV